MGGILRQLRWRIVIANMTVVVVGVVLLLLAAFAITNRVTPASVQAQLAALADADGRTVAAATADVLTSFQRSILTAVFLAALGAIIAGLATSFLLAREILRPLDEIATSSQRIARGHYNERVAVPPSDELALVADNFNQMAESLERVEQQRVALIGNVSHELRTPLAGLNGYLEGLMDGVFAPDEETFALMDKEVRRLRRLVDDLQALSRVEAGQISLRPAVFDLIPLIERVLAQLRAQLEAQNLTIHKAFDLPITAVYADEDRTAQVLTNLVGNAIRYTAEGGAVFVSVKQEASMAQVSIRDTGIGIPPEALPYIFERFYRVDSSRTRWSGGSGIGLTISRHLVWAMGGEVTAVSSGTGSGSTFTFTLPLSKS
ncbi:MAG: ATP-binding protein [Chloroflexota bacterium]